ncbi:MAG: PKD domain-containing protein, partial [Microthrixaceae bacterium]
MRRWAWVGAAVITAISLTVVSLPDAGAQKVANPGAFTITPSGGSIVIKGTAFDLTPRVNPECSDGFNNDGLTGIDFPADPQCTSALDDSELAGGLQTKVDTSLTGTIDGAGVINVPTSGVVLPPAYLAVPDTNPANYPYVVKAAVIPTAAATGSLNPLTGEASIRLRFRIQITGSPFGVYTGASCSIGTSAAPIDINVLTTGTTSPPSPATPISGFPYLSNGTFRMVNNSFAVPGATGCAALIGTADGINGVINSQVGLPSAAGNNSATLDGLTSPVLTRGVAAKITTTPSLLSGESPFTVTFDSASSTVTKTPATYLWTFPDGTTSNATSVTKTFTNIGTNTVRLTITDADGDSSVVQKNVSVLAPTTTTT